MLLQKALFYGFSRACSIPARLGLVTESVREFTPQLPPDRIGIEPASEIGIEVSIVFAVQK